MIDTNELRKIANNTDLHGSKIYCSSVALWMEAVADELDRLYDVERRTTPLTREEIEAELVRRGWVVDGPRSTSCVTYRDKRDWFVVIFPDRLSIGFSSYPHQVVTPQLLDAVLEAK